MKVINYGRQEITDEDINEVITTLKSDFLTQGPKIKEFEDAFSEYVGAPYSIAVSNGTAALHLAMMALGVGKGDGIITTPITFAASANAGLYCEANVHFVDIDPDNYLMDISGIEKLIEQYPSGYFKAIVPVNFGGLAINTEEIYNIVSKHNIPIIEDACHAPGAYFIDSKGEKVLAGSNKYSSATIFSFHPVKHIACGEGGMVTVADPKLNKSILTLRTHGITKDDMTYPSFNKEEQGGWYYEMQELGYNYRLSDIQAALGVSQLKRAESGLERRQFIAKKYRKELGDLVKFQKDSEKYYNALHLFVIEIEDRKGLYDFLRENNIFCQIHYIPVHLLPYYQKLGFKKGDFPNAEEYYDKCISLPMYPALTDDEQDFIISKVKEYLNR